MQMELMLRDKGLEKPAFLRSLTKDKVWGLPKQILIHRFICCVKNWESSLEKVIKQEPASNNELVTKCIS